MSLRAAQPDVDHVDPARGLAAQGGLVEARGHRTEPRGQAHPRTPPRSATGAGPRPAGCRRPIPVPAAAAADSGVRRRSPAGCGWVDDPPRERHTPWSAVSGAGWLAPRAGGARRRGNEPGTSW
ncbi:hypothetical protein GCM10023405_23090 [Streptomonospora salina]